MGHMGNLVEREAGAWQGRKLLERDQILKNCAKEFGPHSVDSEEAVIQMFHPQSGMITFTLENIIFIAYKGIQSRATQKRVHRPVPGYCH